MRKSYLTGSHASQRFDFLDHGLGNREAGRPNYVQQLTEAELGKFFLYSYETEESRQLYAKRIIDKRSKAKSEPQPPVDYEEPKPRRKTRLERLGAEAKQKPKWWFGWIHLMYGRAWLREIQKLEEGRSERNPLSPVQRHVGLI